MNNCPSPTRISNTGLDQLPVIPIRYSDGKPTRFALDASGTVVPLPAEQLTLRKP